MTEELTASAVDDGPTLEAVEGLVGLDLELTVAGLTVDVVVLVHPLRRK